MFNNLLGEMSYVEKIYEEYLSLVNYYANFSRQSIFCRYFNINVERSTYVKGDEATFDKYRSGIRYDVYDYTPLFYIATVTNDIADQQDLIGQMFQGTTNLITFTINTPRVDDLIVFPYAPLNGTEIFKVTNVRAAINAKNSKPAVNWYEITVEYAPLATVKSIYTINKYTYVPTSQKYMLQGEFISMVTYLDLMETYFKSIQKTFDHEYDLYTYTLPDKTVIAPLKINKIIFDHLSTPVNNEALHFSPLRPFGIKNFNHEIVSDPTACVYIGVKHGVSIEDHCCITGECHTNCHFSGKIVYPGEIANYKYPWKTVVEMEYNEDIGEHVEVEKGTQKDYVTLNYMFPINIFDMSILIKTWNKFVKTKFPDKDDFNSTTALYLHVDKKRLVYKQPVNYEIHEMVTTSYS